MKNIILLILTLVSLSAAAESLPWPANKDCARHLGLGPNGKFTDNMTKYFYYSTAWKDVIHEMSIHLKKPDLKLSFEYIQYRSGFTVMAGADYADDCQNLPADDDEIKALKELQMVRPLTSNDFKGSRWIHMITPLDKEEVNCLALSIKNGKHGGCGDLWQDGITDEEAVCIKGKTYLRCHVDCMEKIYNRKVELEPGFCK